MVEGMKDIVIFGNTQLADQIIDDINEGGENRIKAVTVEKSFIPTDSDSFKGIPIYPFEDIEKYITVTEHEFIVCVGYTQMNNIRKKIYSEIKKKGYGITGYIHSSATVLSKNIGVGTLIFEKAVIGRNVSLGEGNIIYPCALIAHHTVVGDYNFFAISSSVAGNVIVGNNCFIGNNASTKNGITIADYTLVGAGSYIAEDTQSYGVYVPPKSVLLAQKKSTDFSL